MKFSQHLRESHANEKGKGAEYYPIVRIVCMYSQGFDRLKSLEKLIL